MKLRCKKETEKVNGKKIMEFTKGKIYEFEKAYDPEGWSTIDDDGNEEIFFLLNIMFEKPTK